MWCKHCFKWFNLVSCSPAICHEKSLLPANFSLSPQMRDTGSRGKPGQNCPGKPELLWARSTPWAMACPWWRKGSPTLHSRPFWTLWIQTGTAMSPCTSTWPSWSAGRPRRETEKLQREALCDPGRSCTRTWLGNKPTTSSPTWSPTWTAKAVNSALPLTMPRVSPCSAWTDPLLLGEPGPRCSLCRSLDACHLISVLLRKILPDSDTFQHNLNLLSLG